MGPLRIVLAAILIAAWGSTEAIAQNTTTQPASYNQFRQFLQSPFHRNLIVRAFAALPPEVFRRCPGEISQSSKIMWLKPVVFAADGLPNDGVWKEMFPISDCGNDTVFNFIFIATADEKVDTIIEYPGTSIADPVLQRDATKFAFIGAGNYAKGCKKFFVKNTQFGGYGLPRLFVNPPLPDRGPTRLRRDWWETWTLVGCGRTFNVPIGFAQTPGRPGTNIIQPLGSVSEQRN